MRSLEPMIKEAEQYVTVSKVEPMVSSVIDQYKEMKPTSSIAGDLKIFIFL